MGEIRQSLSLTLISRLGITAPLSWTLVFIQEEAGTGANSL